MKIINKYDKYFHFLQLSCHVLNEYQNKAEGLYPKWFLNNNNYTVLTEMLLGKKLF